MQATAVAQAPPSQVLRAPKQAVVVGAGPAGVAAALLLARRGFKVNVFEKRPEIDATASDRAIPLGLNSRSAMTLRAAGLALEDVGMTTPRCATVMGGKSIPMPQVQDPLKGQYVVDRMRFADDMYRAALKQTFEGEGAIAWHFGQALEHVDFDTRVASFVPTQPPTAGSAQAAPGPGAGDATSRILAEYDLLVGADGASSAVRAQMVAQVPGLREDRVLENKTSYKTFHGLVPDASMEADLPGVTTSQPGAVLFIVGIMNNPHRRCLVWKRKDGTVSGIIAGPPGWFKEEGLKAAIDDMFPRTLQAWAPRILAQVGEAGTQQHSNMGRVVKVSQFHGPSCVLIGDAAHSVTPNMGQGCNVALESARVLAETLDRVGVEALDAVPAAFTAARIQDAHAAQDLEYHLSLMLAAGPLLIHGKERLPTPWERLVSSLMFTVSGIIYMLLRKLMPKVFVDPMLSGYLGSNASVPFRAVTGVYRALGWGVPLAAALAVVVALGKAIAAVAA